MSLKAYRQLASKLSVEHATTRARLKEERVQRRLAAERLEHINEAQTIVQNVAQTIQQQAHDRIAAVVSRCLSSVFGEEAYEFKIHFERKRGRTEARLVFVREGHELSPRSGSGGGCVDVAAFALRLACLLLTRPSPRRLLVLDEPFKFVHSPLYRERVRIMLETLAEEMDFQFLIATGVPEYECGTVINLGE